jgi:hypothetical protein
VFFSYRLKDDWNEAVKTNTLNQDGLELVEYMAREIGMTFASNVEYFKIANFVNYLLNVNEKTKAYLHVVNKSISVEDGHITYQDNVMSDEEKKMYNSYAEGLEMRN